MTQEEKDLLLRDLCARLPYGVKFQLTDDDGFVYNTTLTGIDLDTGIFYGADIDGSFGRCQIENIKPYLHPMSSMTEEEWRECVNLGIGDEFEDSYGEHRHLLPSHRLYDWLNAHHFDYRGLIKKGLAIAVTKDNNPYKE